MNEPKVYGKGKCPVCGRELRTGETCLWCEMKNREQWTPKQLAKYLEKHSTVIFELEGKTIEINPCRHLNGWYGHVDFWIFRRWIFACSDCGKFLQGKELKEWRKLRT